MILLSHDYEIFLVAMQAVSLSNKVFQYLILSTIMTTICLNSLFTHIHMLACKSQTTNTKLIENKSICTSRLSMGLNFSVKV